MKKAIILLAFVFAVTGVFAQKGKVTSAQTFKDTGKLDKALEAITEATDPSNEKAEKSIPWPKTWEVKGEIYQAIFQHAESVLRDEITLIPLPFANVYPPEVATILHQQVRRIHTAKDQMLKHMEQWGYHSQRNIIQNIPYIEINEIRCVSEKIVHLTCPPSSLTPRRPSPSKNCR